LTYGRLTFLRGCLIHEQRLNREGNHNKKCTSYNHTYYNYLFSDPVEYQLFQCSGNIFNCTAVTRFSAALTMRLENQLYRLSIDEKLNIIKTHQWNDQLTNSIKPLLTKNTNSNEICKCYCDDESQRNTIQSFCQDMVETDSLLGYVLTGVRFKIRDRIVYLEIQQGKLVNGNIDLKTVHWKNSQPCRYYGVLNYNHRSLQLDDVLAPEGYAITGLFWIRYHKRTAYFGFEKGRLILAIKATRVDNHGNLVPEKWLIREKISAPSRVLHVFNQYILSSPTKKSQELSTPNKHYIKFRTTSWSKDFAQHVVPFIDLQEVISNSSKLVTGVGVYYRSRKQYGGFIALKLIIKKSIKIYYLNKSL
ncbi:uncharacterized protein, partial [Chelonus insularis]|uniref:uncharacterized protein n=1 Tax=Chelonus insularis TaxID=460826 RepID=UPI00158B4B3B